MTNSPSSYHHTRIGYGVLVSLAVGLLITETVAAMRDRLLASPHLGPDASSAGAWLLDNYFVVVEQA